MSKSIMIYQYYSGKRTQITQWCNLPDFVLEWFSKTFGNENFDDQLRPFDLNNPEFQKFLLVCAEYLNQPMNYYPIRRFFKLGHSPELEEIQPDFKQFVVHVDRIEHRKLCNNLFWKFKEDSPGEIETREGFFIGKFKKFKRDDFDSGYGKPERHQYHAEYSVKAVIDMWGFPVYAQSQLYIEVRPALLEQNNLQRVSNELLAAVSKNNKELFIRTKIRYNWNDERIWGIEVVDAYDVIKQLNLKR